MLSDFSVLGQRREFRIGTGQVAGVPVAVCSTGIGGPSTEIAVVELARLGVHTVLRVGGMGALRDWVRPGSVCAVTHAVPRTGAAAVYARDSEPRTADPEVLDVLRAEATALGTELARITVASSDTYYLGQGRPLPGLEAASAAHLAALRGLDVDGIDMETETVFSVARALGLRAGALLVAHANRATDAWLEDYEPAQLAMLRLAARSAHRLGQPAQVPPARRDGAPA
ncbi:phosphorylase [Wenjunlia vitaminophila]|uniref:Uridine phosphorylase n=1 Tax=Wenjunlia vitaminophila TaxID=76728 RepID=A0A0T6LTV3_WENVI|nr:phosphorylase [Wenjunlia vitaminophila]